MEHGAARWRPIGAVLVESGAISQAQLDAALADQKQTGRRLGEILIDSGAITWLALAHAIAEQAKDLEVADAPETEEEDDFQPAEAPPLRAVEAPVEPAEAPLHAVEAPLQMVEDPVPVPVSEPEVALDAPPTSSPVRIESVPVGDAEARLQTVEAMLKDRQRAFLELVSTTESLRRAVAKLKDELAARDSELAKVRGQLREQLQRAG